MFGVNAPIINDGTDDNGSGNDIFDSKDFGVFTEFGDMPGFDNPAVKNSNKEEMEDDEKLNENDL